MGVSDTRQRPKTTNISFDGSVHDEQCGDTGQTKQPTQRRATCAPITFFPGTHACMHAGVFSLSRYLKQVTSLTFAGEPVLTLLTL